MGSRPQQRRESREKMPQMGSPECLSQEASSAEEPEGKETEMYTRK